MCQCQCQCRSHASLDAEFGLTWAVSPCWAKNEINKKKATGAKEVFTVVRLFKCFALKFVIWPIWPCHLPRSVWNFPYIWRCQKLCPLHKQPKAFWVYSNLAPYPPSRPFRPSPSFPAFPHRCVRCYYAVWQKFAADYDVCVLHLFGQRICLIKIVKNLKG